ncbi:MAG: hypothetical protein II643_04510, partial [Oscillospiraceae bacterium]|nr:hypothetical protein [Oscillospiraceae bacterium]
TSELIDPVSIESGTGRKKGIYIHYEPDDEYFIKLRANSNLKDEYIGTKVHLNTGIIYEWSYEIEKMSPNEVIVKDFTFTEIGSLSE